MPVSDSDGWEDWVGAARRLRGRPTGFPVGGLPPGIYSSEHGDPTELYVGSLELLGLLWIGDGGDSDASDEQAGLSVQPAMLGHFVIDSQYRWRYYDDGMEDATMAVVVAGRTADASFGWIAAYPEFAAQVVSHKGIDDQQSSSVCSHRLETVPG